MIALRIIKFTDVILHSSSAIRGQPVQRPSKDIGMLSSVESDCSGMGTPEVLRVIDGTDVNKLPGQCLFKAP